jgi:hypothetical protein
MGVQVSFEVPDELFNESVKRLTAIGVSAPQELLETALRASALDRLQVMGGSGPVPTALSDVRAAWLLELCRSCNDILSDEVVAVLFRIMPSTAGSVTRRMQATYEAELDKPLTTHMRAMAKLGYPPQKEESEAPRHRVTFATQAAYAHAARTIAAAGLTGEVTEQRAARSLEFPQKVEVQRDGKKRQLSIAHDVLGLPKK